MRELLLATSKQEMKSVADKYKKKMPEPLNRQFPDQVTKTKALENAVLHKRQVAELYPSGTTCTSNILP